MQIIKSIKLTWIDIKGPTSPDMEHLKNNFNLHPLVLKEIMPQIDYPKIENYGDYLFLVIFYPFFDKETSSTLPFELDIVIGKNFFITNHYRDILPLSALFHDCNLYPEKMEQFSDEGTGELLYRVVNEILQACFPKISHIKQNIDEIEKIAQFIVSIDSNIPYRIDGYIPTDTYFGMKDRFRRPTEEEMKAAKMIAEKYLKSVSILHYGVNVKYKVERIY